MRTLPPAYPIVSQRVRLCLRRRVRGVLSGLLAVAAMGGANATDREDDGSGNDKRSEHVYAIGL